MSRAAPQPRIQGGGLDETLGFELVEASEERAVGRFRVKDELKQPLGVVHGGVYAAIAESICSIATYNAVADAGMVAMGSANHTSFLRPVTEGTVTASARPRHRGRTSWVWEVDITDEDGRLCSLARITVAVREPQPGS